MSAPGKCVQWQVAEWPNSLPLRPVKSGSSRSVLREVEVVEMVTTQEKEAQDDHLALSKARFNVVLIVMRRIFTGTSL